MLKMFVLKMLLQHKSRQSKHILRISANLSYFTQNNYAQNLTGMLFRTFYGVLPACEPMKQV